MLPTTAAPTRRVSRSEPQVRHAGRGQPAGRRADGRARRPRRCSSASGARPNQINSGSSTRAWWRPQPEPRAVRVGAQDEDERADDRQKLREAVRDERHPLAGELTRGEQPRRADQNPPRNPAEDVGPPAVEVEQGEQSRHEERGGAGERAHVDDRQGRRDRLRALGVPRRQRGGIGRRHDQKGCAHEHRAATRYCASSLADLSIDNVRDPAL